MAIDFPNNPVDGEPYVASNGIEYIYSSANDSWTGSIAAPAQLWSVSGANIYATSLTANVGIGTSDPAYRLVVGSTANAVEEIVIYTSDAGSGGVYFGDSTTYASGYVAYAHSNDTLSLGSGGATHLTVSSSGAIGLLGATTVSTTLDVSGDTTLQAVGATNITASGTLTADKFNLESLDSLPS